MRTILVASESSRPFLDWVSMDTLSRNHELNRSMKIRFIDLLYYDIGELLRRLLLERDKKKNPWIWSMSIHDLLPLARGFREKWIIADLMPRRAAFRARLDR